MLYSCRRVVFALLLRCSRVVVALSLCGCFYRAVFTLLLSCGCIVVALLLHHCRAVFSLWSRCCWVVVAPLSLLSRCCRPVVALLLLFFRCCYFFVSLLRCSRVVFALLSRFGSLFSLLILARPFLFFSFSDDRVLWNELYFPSTMFRLGGKFSCLSLTHLFCKGFLSLLLLCDAVH